MADLNYREGMTPGMGIFTCIMALVVFFLLYDFVLEHYTGQCGRWWPGKSIDVFNYAKGE